MAHLKVEEIVVRYPALTPRDRSLRHTMLKRASLARSSEPTGMKIMENVIDGLSFELNPGDRLGVVGPNGAGKTTLLRALAGIFKPQSGRVVSSGRLVPILNIGVGMHAEATGRENILTCGLFLGADYKELMSAMDEIADFTELGEYLDAPIYTYSSGMRVRLSFAVATAVNPDILILDEWLGVADPAFRQKAEKRMMQLVNQAKIIVFASHNLSQLLAFCNKALVLRQGEAPRFGAMEEMKQFFLPAKAPDINSGKAEQKPLPKQSAG